MLTAMNTRTERDTFGPIEVPADRLWGAQTQRSLQNFDISGERQAPELIRALAQVKRASAVVNHALGLQDKAKTDAIVAAADEVIAGKHTQEFPLVVWQTGSGTQTNMNLNEVIANRASERLGGERGEARLVHPNDDVNRSQSSNDVFPTAMHVAAVQGLVERLLPPLRALRATLQAKAVAFDGIVKIGRTHLQDATPIRLGQEFGGFAAQMRHAGERLARATVALSELPLGGTAVGTGINTDAAFGGMVAAELSRRLSVPFREARNHFEAQHAKDAFVEASGALKTVAVSLTKIANDIRLMGSGPRCGLGELLLPAVQPGSSIMPGKVNPVICEAVIMASCRVIANDAAVTLGGLGGVGSLLDLNVAMPMMAEAMLDSIGLLARSCHVLTDNLLKGLRADETRCAELIEQSLAMCTSLVPAIGYDRSAALAKQAHKEGKTVRALALEQGVLPAERLAALLDPQAMTTYGNAGAPGGG